MSRRAWTTNDAKRLHELRSLRVPMRKIAAELGRTEDAVYSFLRYIPASPGVPAKMGHVPRLPPRSKPELRSDYWTAEELRTLRSYAEEGATALQTAEALGRTHSAVRCQASRMGITFPRNKAKSTSVYRLEQETNRYHRNAAAGSAKLRDAILALAA